MSMPFSEFIVEWSVFSPTQQKMKPTRVVVLTLHSVKLYRGRKAGIRFSVGA